MNVEGVEVPTEHFIDGRRVGGRDRIEVRSPIDWDGWVLAEVPAGGPGEVDLAVGAARRAFPAWAALGPHGRHEILTRLAEEIDAAVPDLAAVECVDNGSLHEAMRARVLPRAANNIRFFADWARSRLEEPPRTLPGGERNTVRHDPAGVVAVSTPWNAPFMLATWRVGPALAAGNTVVLKPPEWAPLTCSMLGELAERAGLPPGVLNIVHGTGAQAGAPLTGHADIARVAFTGSPATARTVYHDAAAVLTPVSFELGGKSPFLVFADADLDAAATTAAYQYDNAGQVCLAGTRLLVEEAVLEPFLERFLERVAAIVVGDPRETATTYGPLIHPVALERVTARVARAIEQGARLRFGGEPLHGLYYPPTLFDSVGPGAEILYNEVFGPVLTLQSFADETQAIAMANDGPYGLAATVFTGSRERSDRLGEALVAGTVWVNCFYVRDLETPFGGARDSGIGREGGRHSFDFYCDVKTVCERFPSGLILSHGDLGPAALLGEWLQERGRPYEVHDVSRTPLPALGDAPFVASLGSEQSANDASLEWVGGELALLREAVAADIPVLGLCFGGQALCLALGGEVSRATPPQIGWFEVSGEIAAGPWFHWHYEQLGVPPGARELARSPAGPAAFRKGPHLGVQFHPEVTTEVVADWSRSEAELAKLGIDPPALVEETRRRAPQSRPLAFALFDAWWGG